MGGTGRGHGSRGGWIERSREWRCWWTGSTRGSCLRMFQKREIWCRRLRWGRCVTAPSLSRGCGPGDSAARGGDKETKRAARSQAMCFDHGVKVCRNELGISPAGPSQTEVFPALELHPLHMLGSGQGAQTSSDAAPSWPCAQTPLPRSRTEAKAL
eukprot:759477-Rhodomonas_salina.3